MANKDLWVLLVVIGLTISFIGLLYCLFSIGGDGLEEYQGIYINGELDFCSRAYCRMGNCKVSFCKSGKVYSGDLELITYNGGRR